jgi:hypothetical protein
MGNDIINLHFRFGHIAVDKGFVTAEHLEKALTEQIDNDIPLNRLRPHRFIGEVLLEKGWITLKQNKIVLAHVLKNKQQKKIIVAS